MIAEIAAMIERDRIDWWRGLALMLLATAGTGGLDAAAAETAGKAGLNPDVPLLVNETTRELEAAGCEAVPVGDRQRLNAVKALGWVFAVAADAGDPVLLACPPEVDKISSRVTGTQSGGEVAGISETSLNLIGQEARAQPPAAGPGGAGAPPQLPPQEEVGEAGGGVGEAGGGIFGWLAGVAMNLINWVLGLVIGLIVVVESLLIQLMSHLIIGALSFGSFVNNPVVIRIWPIVLGVANLGFMLALVTIALLTTLGLEVGGGTRRLLPRLFIGALLVNFSLVIGGLILDVMKIFMVAIPVILGLGSLSTLAQAIQVSLNIPGNVLELFDWVQASGAFANMVKALLTTIILGVVILAMAVMTFGLIIRYLMLLGLLIVSPFAYLFMGFPGLTGLARQWWTAFIKYAIFGPIALFFLLAGIAAADEHVLRDVLVGGPGARAAAAVFDMLILAGFMYAGATAGKYAGTLGAATAVAIATKRGKSGVRAFTGRYNPQTGQYKPGSVIRGASGVAAMLGGRKLSRYARESTKEFMKPVRRKLGRGEYSPYDDKGKLKPGRTTPGVRRGVLARSPEARAAVAAARGPDTAIAGHKDLSAEMLRTSDFKKAATNADLDKIVEHGDDDQRLTLAADVNVVRRLDNKSLSRLLGSARADIREAVNRSMRDVDRRDNV